MRHWDKLSFELITIIFSNLKTYRSLVSCQLVCKNWHDPAQLLLYKKVDLYNSNDLYRLNQIPSTHSRPFLCTQELDIHCDKGFFVSNKRDWNCLLECLVWILKHCCNLKRIYIREQDDMSPLFKIISSHRGKKLCLKSIPKPRCTFEEEVTEYGKAAWKLRDTLTSLTVTNTGVLPYIDLNSEDESTTKLNQFSRIEEIEYHFEENKSIYLHKVFRSIRSQNSIKAVYIKLFYHHTYTPSISTVYERNETYKNVRTLSILNAICGDSLVNYIIHTFSNVKQCTIHFNGVEEVGVLNRLSLSELELKTATCVKFLDYLDRMECCKINHIYVDKLMDTINLYLPSIIMICMLTISYHHGGNRMYVTKRAESIRHLHAEFSSFPDYFDGILPHQFLIEKFGCSIQHLMLNTSIAAFKKYVHWHLDGYALHYVLENCSSLRTLYLNYLKIKESTIMISSSFLEKLRFTSCSFDNTASVTQLSPLLPRLNLLHWQNSKFLDAEHVWEIFMEDTTFDTIVIEESEDRYRKFYIRIYIKSLDETQLHFVDTVDETAREIHEFDFIDDLEDLEHYNLLLVDIKCKSLKNLGVRTSNFDVAVSTTDKPLGHTHGCDEDIVNNLL